MLCVLGFYLSLTSINLFLILRASLILAAGLHGIYLRAHIVVHRTCGCPDRVNLKIVFRCQVLKTAVGAVHKKSRVRATELLFSGKVGRHVGPITGGSRQLTKGVALVQLETPKAGSQRVRQIFKQIRVVET